MLTRIGLALVGAVVVALGTAAEEPYDATVVDVRSGYVLRLEGPEGEHTVFLFGVLAPMTTEVEGRQAQRRAEALALNETVTVISRVEDGGIRYADVLLPDGRNLAHVLLREGYVDWDRVRAPDDDYLRALETLGKREHSARDLKTREEVRDRVEVLGEPSRRLDDTRSDYIVYRDENGVLTIESKGAIDRQTLLEHKREFEAQKQAQREEEFRKQLELEREYAATMSEVQRQQAEARQQELERREQLLALENQALRNEAQRIRNEQFYSPFPYYGPYVYPNAGFYWFPIFPTFKVKHDSVRLPVTEHQFGHPLHQPAPNTSLSTDE